MTAPQARPWFLPTSLAALTAEMFPDGPAESPAAALRAPEPQPGADAKSVPAPATDRP
ncbi:hypothetical protein [Streptomyces sp. NPDC048650]|uniref:hypothetical protein n=1 Tax=unclassified Streptomyces TaxID=2593676 RepID=UPI003715B0BB